MAAKHVLVVTAALAGGAIFASMGYAMWNMMGAMNSMRDSMTPMQSYMRNMGDQEGYMSSMRGDMQTMAVDMAKMSKDMGDMRGYMLMIGGDREQVKAYKDEQAAGKVQIKATAAEMAAVNQTCQEFLGKAGLAADSVTISLDEIAPEAKRYESHMAAMRRDMNEMDKHIFCMYLSMSADMQAMRESMRVMTPSVATMGPVMNRMGYDMNRGVGSFTNPMNYMFNAVQ